MTTVCVGEYWKGVCDVSFQQLREMLDAAEVDLRAKGATEVSISGVDVNDETICLQGTRPQTAEELEEEEMYAAMSRYAAVQRSIEYIERITGKEVKLV